ncbi:MAG: EAL domain-containing protein [Gammaproteobacteria bacterium]|nr:EAL domain-containing protein [Gammaproteobacteria bacterium]MDH5734505.1 EAL domain-containing protein [Gammaproteobacteria bacterium]
MQKPLILVVDDDPAVRLLCSETLGQSNFIVKESSNGIQALEIIDEITPDLILLDVIMPEMNGFDACSLIRKNAKFEHTPIIIMTGLEDIESIDKAFDAGATNFITKPINWTVLSHNLRYIHRSSTVLKELHSSEQRNLEIQKELRDQQIALDHMAHHDALTGLPNRILFNEHLTRAISISIRKGQKLAVLFLDLDDFKWVNDTLGHHVGDELLKEFSKRLNDALRSDDYVATADDNIITRFGGDEFIMILSDIKDEFGPCAAAKRIIESVKKPFIFSGREFHVGASIGISIFPTDGDNAEMLIKNSDVAMYHAKSLGKNNYQYFSEDLNNTVSNRLDMENKLRSAIANDQFFLLYQPQINIDNGNISGIEALIRWNDPETGLISPVDFIPIAEDTGLIMQLGEWLINEVCRQNREWQDAGYAAIRTSINISNVQFERQDLTGVLSHILEAYNINPELLEIELTERIYMANPERTSKILAELRARGITIALDDFGTGFSSLSYLRHYPIDTLKIDRSFICEINVSSDGEAVIEAIIQMAHAMKLKVIAEGVENHKQFEFLKQKNCDSVQGYYLYSPLPAEKIEELLRKIKPINNSL